MHPLFKLYLNGVASQGPGGVVYKKGDSASYVFPKQFADERFRGGMQGMVDTAPQDVFYIVEETEGQAVVRAYNIQSILSDAAGDHS